MQRKLLFLVNPISGTKKKPKLIRSINNLTARANLDYEIMATRADGNYQFLPAYITEKQITDVIICGGDGTVSTITAWLLDTNVAVGIIPMGSGNGLALTARIPHSTKKALQIIYEGHSQFIDGFWINGQFSCMMCGMGNDAQIAHDFALTKVRGLKTYLKLSLKRFLRLKTYSFTIETSLGSIQTSAYFITVSNSNQFGNFVTIAPRASLNDGLLDIVVVKKMNRMLLPFALLHQITGHNPMADLSNISANKGIIYFQGKELVVKNRDCAPLHIDGEPQPITKDVTIKILPNAFRLLQPFRSTGQASQ